MLLGVLHMEGVYIYMYICMYMCMYVYVYICVYTYTHTHTHTTFRHEVHCMFYRLSLRLPF